MYRFSITDRSGLPAPCVDLDIVPGETLVLVLNRDESRGELLHRMAGLSEHGLSDWQGIAPAISHLLRQPLLLPWRSVEENLVLVNEDRYLVGEVMRWVGLDDYRITRSSQLPLDALRRTALARCLLMLPDLIVMDDPVSDLPGPAADNLRCLIRELVIENPERTLVYGTANLDEACELGGRVMMVADAPVRIERELYNPSRMELLA